MTEEWNEKAACRNNDDCDPDQFFPDGNGRWRAGQVDKAKKICADCPVKKECLNYALRGMQAYGIWGGKTEDERRSILRKTMSAFLAESPHG
ncbi:WhiB family transcriptional regulator [Frankia sp. Cj3]|uniref:WhiB family transcriptional regulator n=1 Tax=Frankia sp. Cj3 TaxID=2880976 RepID=UPI001EF56D30|nr:WhiB family transcriptional regulator [Frankia sp. Cj3]